MQRQHWLGLVALATGGLIGLMDRASAQYAVEVMEYNQGTTPHLEWQTNDPYNIPSAALDAPERTTGEGTSYPSVVSPFSPPYLRNEIVSVGEGGWLTLRLSNYALAQAIGPEIGVFTNVGLADIDWPSGQAGAPVFALGADRADVEVSENGIDWISLGSPLFDIPTNAFTDLTDPYAIAAGSLQANFQQPFTSTLSDFDGLQYSNGGGSDILDLLAGSGVGTWLDISSSGLSKVGYLRFSVLDDGTDTKLNFELDAVSIAASALGTATVPEPTGTLIATIAGLLLAPTHRRGQT